MSDQHLKELTATLPDLPDEPVRQITVDEAMSVLVTLLKDERFEAAQEVIQRILETVPGHPQALHFSGVLAHRSGRSAEAIELIEKSIALVPDYADWHSNLGIVLQEIGRLDDAIAAYQRAIALNPQHANAYSNLGVLLRAIGKPAESEAAYRTAIQLDPEHIDAYANLGILLNGLKRTDESVVCFCKVITLRPKHREARKLLALAHCTLGETDKAVTIFEEWLAEEPGNPIAQHMLAACTGRGVPERASDGFVEGTFDNFAASFEAKLEKLSYRAPALVAAMVEDAGVVPSKHLDVLDAGCGTGWCGPLLAPYARHLTGVDLSAGMLERAKEKQTYDELVKGELTEFLATRHEAFDVIVSADTLVYFGDLAAVVAAAAKALRPEGLLVFTVEHAVDETVGDYRLETHGRYVHTRGYTQRLLEAAGLQVTIVEAELRMESGSPVAGMVVRATKPAGARAAVSMRTGATVRSVPASGVRDA